MPSQDQISEAGNACPICQEELSSPVALRVCKVETLDSWLMQRNFVTNKASISSMIVSKQGTALLLKKYELASSSIRLSTRASCG